MRSLVTFAALVVLAVVAALASAGAPATRAHR